MKENSGVPRLRRTVSGGGGEVLDAAKTSEKIPTRNTSKAQTHVGLRGVGGLNLEFR